MRPFGRGRWRTRRSGAWGIRVSAAIGSWVRPVATRRSQSTAGLRCFVLLLSGTNLLYHFPFLFTVASDVFLEPEFPGTLRAAEFRREMMRPDVLARVVHVVLASFAVTGVTLIGYGLRLQRQEKAASDGQRVARSGGYLALITSLIQVPVGLWLITVLPADWHHERSAAICRRSVMLGGSVLLVALPVAGAGERGVR